MFYISAETDIGISKKVNQDCYFAVTCQSSAGPLAFACVCDGMGGLSFGELAGATVVIEFKKWLYNELPQMTGNGIRTELLKSRWSQIIADCNRRITEYGVNGGYSLGTTLTAVLLWGNGYYAVNIGDTRLYEIGSGVRLITRDHTYVQQEIDAGRMTAAEAAMSGKGHILTRCVGAGNDSEPEFYFGKLKKNAVYLVCSDGFRHKISDEELLRSYGGGRLSSESGLSSASRSLIELNKSRTEKDNITAVTVFAGG